MDRVVHIYSDRGPISIVLVLAKGAMVALGVFLLIRAFGRGEAGQVMWMAVLLIAGGGFFGGYDLIKLLDRAPQLTLSAAGFCDSRKSMPVVIPWDHVRALGYRGGGSTGWSLEIFVMGEGRGSVVVPGSHLAVTPKELVRLVREFAPGVEVDKRFRLWLG